MQLVVASRVRILWSTALTLWTHYYRRGRARAAAPPAPPSRLRARPVCDLRPAGGARERGVAGAPAGAQRALSARSLAVQGRRVQAHVKTFATMRTARSPSQDKVG
jgi:hypothetical protein